MHLEKVKYQIHVIIERKGKSTVKLRQMLFLGLTLAKIIQKRQEHKEYL